MKTLSKQEAFLLLLGDFGGIKGLAVVIFATEDMIKNWMYRQVKVPLQFAILMVFVSRGKVHIVSFYEPDELTPAIQRASDIITPSLKERFNRTEFIQCLNVAEPKAYLPQEFIENFAELCVFERPVVCDERNHLITGFYQYGLQKARGEKLINIVRVNIKKLLADPKPIPNILEFSVFERVLIGMRIENVYKVISATPNIRQYRPSVRQAVVSGRLARFKNQTEYGRLKKIYKCADCEIMKQVASGECSIFEGVKRIDPVKLDKENAEIIME